MIEVSAAPVDTSKIDAAFEAVSAACVLRGVTVARLANLKENTLGIELTGTTRKWPVYVDCAEENLRLPSVHKVPANALLGHVSYSGLVCIDDGQGLSLDPKRPADIAW